MEEFILRNKNKKKEITSLAAREEKKLSLRKEHISNAIMSSRIKESLSIPIKEDYMIQIDDLHVENNDSVKLFMSVDNDMKIKLALEMLNSPDISLYKFGIKQILNFLSVLDKSHSSKTRELFTDKVLETLMENMFKPGQEKKIIYETCCVFIYLTYFLPDYSVFLVQYLDRLFTSFLVNQNDNFIKSQVLWVFIHVLLEKKEEVKSKMQNYNALINLVFSTIDQCRTNSFELLNYLGKIFWLYGLLYTIQDPHELIVQRALKDIPVIAQFTVTQLKLNVFNEAVYAIKEFLIAYMNDDKLSTTKADNPYYKMIIKCDFPKNLTNKIFEENEINDFETKNSIINILINITYLSNKQTLRLIEEGILEQIEKCLDYTIRTEKTNKKKFINSILDLIHNICDCDDETVQNSVVRKSSVCKYLIQMGNNKQFSFCFEEIIGIFLFLLELGSIRIQTELVVIKLPELLDEMLSEFEFPQNNELAIKCLSCMKILFEYGEGMIKGRNIITDLYNFKLTKSKLEKLASFTEEGEQIKIISSLASEILEKYFPSN